MIDIDALFPLRSERMTAALEAAPTNLITANALLNYRYPLNNQDDRYVLTSQARSETFERRFNMKLSFDQEQNRMLPVNPNGLHLLMFGHVGCGKSTELRQLTAALHHPDRYWVVQVDLLELIDTNNVRYCDVWFAVAKELVRQLQEDGLAIPNATIRRLHEWFGEHVFTKERVREAAASLCLEAEAGGGIPLLGKVLGRLTSMIRGGSACRETLREVMRSTYYEFAASFNALVAETTDALRARGSKQHVLFVIDGPDRFNPDDWRRFFVEDVNQLSQLQCFAVYAAPLALKVSGHRLDMFDHITLPMVKLLEADEATRRPAAFDALRELVLKRCHHSLFDDLAALDRLIEHSGGHLRDLLRLLSHACIESLSRRIDAYAVEAAIDALAADYRYHLTEAQYLALATIDRAKTNTGTSPMLADLVGTGALLEYNAGSWRRSHPVVRTLAGYAVACDKLRPRLVETEAA